MTLRDKCKRIRTFIKSDNSLYGLFCICVFTLPVFILSLLYSFFNPILYWSILLNAFTFKSKIIFHVVVLPIVIFISIIYFALKHKKMNNKEKKEASATIFLITWIMMFSLSLPYIFYFLPKFFAIIVH